MKVEIENNTKSQAIDWSKPQLVIHVSNKNILVQVSKVQDKDEFQDENELDVFCGQSLMTGEYSVNWIKNEFIPFEGTVTIKSERNS
jgi:hypothetical protein